MWHELHPPTESQRSGTRPPFTRAGSCRGGRGASQRLTRSSVLAPTVPDRKTLSADLHIAPAPSDPRSHTWHQKYCPQPTASDEQRTRPALADRSHEPTRLVATLRSHGRTQRSQYRRTTPSPA